MTQLIASVPIENDCINTGDKIETLSILRGIATPVNQTISVTNQQYIAGERPLYTLFAFNAAPILFPS